MEGGAAFNAASTGAQPPHTERKQRPPSPRRILPVRRSPLTKATLTESAVPQRAPADLARPTPNVPHSPPHSSGPRHAHPACGPDQGKLRPLGRRLRPTPGGLRPPGPRRTSPRRPRMDLGRGGRPGNPRQQPLRKRRCLAAKQGRRPRALQRPSRPNAQIPGQAPHKTMDRNHATSEPGADRPAAAGLPQAESPETRRCHRPGPGLLVVCTEAGIVHDGPATIPAHPVPTGRPHHRQVDAGIHRRRRPAAGTAGRDDAGRRPGPSPLQAQQNRRPWQPKQPSGSS